MQNSSDRFDLFMKSRHLRKLSITMRELKKTGEHHYGKGMFNLARFFYYSLARINTFIIYENSLLRDLPDHNLGREYRVVKPTLMELSKAREGLNLPREFYYDQIYNAKTCYLAFKGDELAYIPWVFFKGDYSRFLILREGIAELNYNTTRPNFRGMSLSARMMAYICKDLQDEGYERVMGVIHEFNYPSIKCIKRAGFTECGRIRAMGPFHRKVKV